MENPEQLIEKLDEDRNGLVSLDNLEKNISKLNEKDLEELRIFLTKKDAKIENAFTNPETRENILHDFVNSLIEKEEITPDEKKILKLCNNAGIINSEMAAYVGRTKTAIGFREKWMALKWLETHQPEDEFLDDIFGEIYNLQKIFNKNSLWNTIQGKTIIDLESWPKEHITIKNKSDLWELNYQLKDKLENILSWLRSIKEKYKEVKNNFRVDDLMEKIGEYEKKIMLIRSKKDYLNDVVKEEIPLDQMLSEVGLPQIPWLSKTGIKVTKHDGKLIGKNNSIDGRDGYYYSKETHFNYTIKKGAANIFITWYEDGWYKITWYYANSWWNMPIFGAEAPLAEKMDAFYNVLWYKKTLSKGWLELDNINQTGLWEVAKEEVIKMYAKQREVALFLSSAKVSQEDIYIMMYIMTGKIKIKEFKENIDIKKFEIINLSGIKLTSIPPEIGEFSGIDTLFLSNNNLSSLPPEIGKLKELIHLKIDYNQLTALPPEIGKLENVNEIFAWHNQISFLPSEIGNLKKLITLDVKNNSISLLPPQIGDLKELLNLDIRSNQITILPPEIGDLTNMMNLHLAGNQLTVLPSEIVKLSQLVTLNLEANHLTSLPPEIAKLKVRVAYLSHNQLTSIPDLRSRKGTSVDIRYNFLPPSEEYKLPDAHDFSPQNGEEEKKKENEEKKENVIKEIIQDMTKNDDIDDVFEKEEGEYVDALRGERNPASDILGNSQWQQNLSPAAFGNGFGNGMPESKKEKNVILIESITPALPDNYRWGIFDIHYNHKKKTSEQVKIEGTYNTIDTKHISSENKQIYTMKFWELPGGMHQIILPLGARIIDKWNIEENSWCEIKRDKKTGLYRLIIPKNTTLKEVSLQFILEKETNWYDEKEDQLDEYKKILPNIWPDYSSEKYIKLEAKEKAAGIQSWIQTHSYYGFDTEFDRQLTKYKNNPVEYCQKLYEEWTKRYEGTMMMVCNQSSLFATLLLKKNGIPARIAVGLPWNKNVSWPGHARTEYRDGSQRNKLDATPSATPPKHLAKEMYDKQKKIQSEIKKIQTQEMQEKAKSDKRTVLEKLVSDFSLLPENIKDRVNFQNMEELNFENIPLTTEQLTTVIYMTILNEKNLEIKNIFLWGTGITGLPSNITKLKNIELLDISDTNIPSSNAKKLTWLQNLKLVSAPEIRHENTDIPEKIKNILKQLSRKNVIIKG